jgi:hypothetical protein
LVFSSREFVLPKHKATQLAFQLIESHNNTSPSVGSNGTQSFKNPISCTVCLPSETLLPSSELVLGQKNILNWAIIYGKQTTQSTPKHLLNLKIAFMASCEV